jgi:hypothetical protein
VLLGRLGDWSLNWLLLHRLGSKRLRLFLNGNWLHIREINLGSHIHVNGHNLLLFQLCRLLGRTFEHFGLSLRLLVTDVE